MAPGSVVKEGKLFRLNFTPLNQKTIRTTYDTLEEAEEALHELRKKYPERVPVELLETK